MKFYAHQGHNQVGQLEDVAPTEVDGIITPVSYPARPRFIKAFHEAGKTIVLDPQTYKLPYMGKRTQVFNKNLNKTTIQSSQMNSTRKDSLAETSIRLALARSADILVAPYFYIEHVGDPEFDISLEMVGVCESKVTQAGFKGSVYAGIFVDDAELRSTATRNRLLNRLTGSDIQGCYFIPNRDQVGGAPLADVSLVTGMIETAIAMQDNDIDVIFAYTDMVGLGLSAFAGASFASGIEASQRKLKFSEQTRDASGGRTPLPRFYGRRLLNSVLVTGELSALVAKGKANLLACQCGFCANVMAAYDPTNPGTYDKRLGNQHYLVSAAKDVAGMRNRGTQARKDAFMNRLQIAARSYKEIEQANITLDKDSTGRHVAAWEKAFTPYL